MTFVTIIGLVAGALTTLAFLPQVVKTWRVKSSEDLSLGTFALIFTGVALWLVYGLLTDDLPIILANVVTLGLVGTVLGLAIRYRRRPPSE
ncbi:MAG: SemiSWEET transporter [Rhodothermales bacterium]|nr:SemiSWEET transporter [Rhodothermales bacterium]